LENDQVSIRDKFKIGQSVLFNDKKMKIIMVDFIEEKIGLMDLIDQTRLVQKMIDCKWI
jgi:hypothetical protein